MECKNVFLTGGTGFVGMNIAQELLGAGYNVVLYARKRPEQGFLEELGCLSGTIYFEQGDVMDQENMEHILKKYEIDTVIHGAAITPGYEVEKENPLLIMNVNCIGLLKSMCAAHETGVKKFFYLGSVSGYGETAFQEEPLVEGVSLGNPHSLYELSKFTGERMVLRMRELYQMDAYVMRIGDVYGPWERYTGDRSHMSLIYQTTVKAMTGEKITIPRPCLQDWVCGLDIAGEVRALMEAEKLNYDVYPLCSNSRWTLLAWCELLKEKYPEFGYELAKNSAEATIQVNQTRDNAPMSLERVMNDTGYVPRQNSAKAAFECYMNWIEEHPEFRKKMLTAYSNA